ncbi:ACP S-malonyltransferase [Leptolyngbya sp. FACHB-711]|uniref:ACP S-malonyltransferase n=1 Tax=Leptolyngbya sp. FACHB-711 TaxID=2692813 RepID=UPI001685D489|nr:ACP S-malonyltransferase [Leptolyngbya sp. FACHB-711]MBD1853878.1 ACP S-malonyltransferase [Cyanobacteria bacterium FACHB-502]MBD2024313.1 ACP S-malonyltransferase [Leptolyngbya sp. FACHB-711]
MKTAWVFPGQGSQASGMGSDLLEIESAKARFVQAEKILGWSVPEICQSAEDKLSKTLYTQPCLYVIEAVLTDLMRDRGLTPDVVAGHSLGEYSALYAAGVFDFESGLRLVKRRSELMEQASGGLMAALIGFDRAQLEAQLAQTPSVVLANDNSDAQVVISGTPEAVETIMANVKSKKAVKLNVSGAFHSPQMSDAATEFNQVLETIAFQSAQVPVLSNVDPTPATDAALLRDRLMRQMTGSVRWREISLAFTDLEINQAIEVGPGKVLTGLLKRACPGMELANVSSLAEIPAQAF